MTRRRAILLFCARAAAVYIVLLALWPLTRAPFAAAYRGGLELTLGPVWPGRTVRFVPAAIDQGFAATEVIMQNPGANREGRRISRTWFRGYLPMTVLASLTLAAARPWPKRLRTIAWGTLIMAALIALGELFMLLETFGGENDVALFRPGPVTAHLIASGAFIFAKSPGTILLLPILIWAGLTVRRADWEAFFTPATRDGKQA
jgi:hypothetical protein